MADSSRKRADLKTRIRDKDNIFCFVFWSKMRLNLKNFIEEFKHFRKISKLLQVSVNFLSICWKARMLSGLYFEWGIYQSLGYIYFEFRKFGEFCDQISSIFRKFAKILAKTLIGNLIIM